MKAKDYLSQAYRLDQKINCKLDQVSNLRSLAMRATASIHAERVSGKKQISSMENAIVKLIDLEQEINKDIDRLVDLKRNITKVIGKINKQEYQLLLELRYLNYKTWEEIAETMNYSWRNIHYIHSKALKDVDIDGL